MIRPLIFDYPFDQGCFEDPESTFMVGDAIKVSPVIAKGTKTYQVYFPAGRWADLNSPTEAIISTGAR